VAFLGAVGVAAALAGALSLVVATIVNVGTLAGPYASIVVWAAVVRGGLFVWNRPDRHRRYDGYFDEVVDAAKQAALGSLAIVVFTFFWRDGMRNHDFSYSRLVFVIDLAVSAVLLAFVACGGKRTLGQLRRRGHDSLNVVVMGSTGTSAALVSAMDQHPETGYHVVGVVDDCTSDDCDAVEELRQLAATINIDEVVLASPALSRSDIYRLVSLPELHDAQVAAAPDLFGLPPTKVRLAPVGDFPLLALGNEPLPGARRLVKRAVDVIVAGFVLVAVSPVMLAVGMAIKLTSPGPVLFRQNRVGMDGRPFRVLKFRTMTTDASTKIHEDYVTAALVETNGDIHDGLHKLVDDPRITTVGKFLRKFSLDELPQLVNVLRGDMSLVGPRPALAFEVELYTNRQRRRLDVRPGMTGLWQVSGRNRLPILQMLELDAQYAERWTFAQDLRILLRTIPALLRREAA
jgi:exopolysaccharide biosynthesis polyprenyl glycosylphosphotransferase